MSHRSMSGIMRRHKAVGIINLFQKNLTWVHTSQNKRGLEGKEERMTE